MAADRGLRGVELLRGPAEPLQTGNRLERDDRAGRGEIITPDTHIISDMIGDTRKQ